MALQWHQPIRGQHRRRVQGHGGESVEPFSAGALAVGLWESVRRLRGRGCGRRGSAPRLRGPLPPPLVRPRWCSRPRSPEAPGAVRRVRGRETERRGREGRGERTLRRVGGSAWAGRSLRPPSYPDPAGVGKAPCSHVPCANVRFIRFLSVPRTPDV